MMMFLAGSIALGQLCYNADADIDDGQALSQAQVWQEPLSEAMQKRQSGCWSIPNEKALEEAKRLVAADPTQQTLLLK